MSKHEELSELYSKAKVRFHVDGNFTICELTYRGNRVFGAAKRNPQCDPFIKERGENIAYARALRNLDAKFQDPLVAFVGRTMELLGK